MKTAVLLGLSGVLARPTYERGRARLSSLARRTLPDAAAIFESDRYLAFASGQLTSEQFLLGLARSLAIDAPYERLAEAWNESLSPWTEVAEIAARTMDGGHPVYLAATIDPLRYAHLRPVLPVLDRLSGLQLSFEVRMVQPELAFLTRALDRFGLKAAQCVLIDGRRSGVEAARAVGMPGFHFTGDTDALLAFLHRWDHEVR